jgi:L-lactate dehydrogenase complex protein LldG
MDENLISKFIERAQEQHAEVLTVESGLIADAIKKIALESGARTFSLSDDLQFPITDTLKEVGLQECPPPADVAVTGASWAVAETGTIVIEASRRLFITSGTHIAVVSATKLLSSLDDLPLIDGLTPPFTLVTGPSRTADIERVLVLGAHGPRRLVVVLHE